MAEERVAGPSGSRQDPEGEAADGALYPKLRPRRNGPSRGEVYADQRERLCGAMIQAVAAHGYSATTTREVARLAGVSTRTLHERFADEGGSKQQCFLATFDALVDRAVARIVASGAGARGWRDGLCNAFAVFAQEIARDPEASRLVLVEALGAGPVALERLERASAQFEAMVSVSLQRAPGNVQVPPVVVQGIVAGIARVVRVRLMEGRAEVLPELADELLQWALSYRSQAAARLQTLGRPTLPPPPAVGAARQAISGEVAGGEHDARKRILLAASELAVRTGYRALTIERITAAAGVRRRTFSALFEDREDCFLHAFELQGDRALRLVSVAGLSNATGPGGLYRAVAALMEHTARDPVFAGVSFVEIFAVGPAGLPVRERRMERLADGIMDAACSPSGPPRELTLQASVGAVWGIVHHHVANGKAAELPALAGELSYMLLAPILGPEEAVKTILAEHAMLAAAATRSEH